ncbi:MAG: PilZ domain-containing protein [Candidatus Aminicenantales bacterium]|jgi:c-di-GMP-binding flagellar brake protein YcgR
MKERRRDPRTKEENKVILSPVPGGGPQADKKEVYYCLTKDLSIGGIRIMTNAPLAVGSRVKVEISLTKSRKSIQALAEVRWVNALIGEEVYDMGLEFVGIDSETELVLIDHVYGKSPPKT